MGASSCAACCDRGISEKIPCNQRDSITAQAPQWAQPRPVDFERITGLSYAPPPAKEEEEEIRDLIGTHLPQTPEVLATSRPMLRCAGAESKNYGRPGEPVNKVFVQFSNDFEGFLPYSLVISDEIGLDFKAMNAHPDFRIDPLNVLKAVRLDYATLSQNATFVELSKNIAAQPLPADAAAGGARTEGSPEERVKPPYEALVQLSVRRTVLEGGQALVFIAVQSDRLAAELVRSCGQLKRRRAIQYYCDSHQEVHYHQEMIPDDSHLHGGRGGHGQGGQLPPSETLAASAQDGLSRYGGGGASGGGGLVSPLARGVSKERSPASLGSAAGGASGGGGGGISPSGSQQVLSPGAGSALDTMSSTLPNHGSQRDRDLQEDPLRPPDDEAGEEGKEP